MRILNNASEPMKTIEMYSKELSFPTLNTLPTLTIPIRKTHVTECDVSNENPFLNINFKIKSFQSILKSEF